QSESRRAAELLERLPAAERGRVRGWLSEVLRSADGYETAVEAVLAQRLEGLLVDDGATALDLLRQIRDERLGPATALARDAGREAANTGFVPLGRPLTDFVSADARSAPVLHRLLRDVYLVDDLGAAIARFGVDHPPATFVTRAGEVLDRSGALTGGSRAPGALTRGAQSPRLSPGAPEVAPRRARPA